MAANFATVPVLLTRLAAEPVYAPVVAALRAGARSSLPWAVALRAARAALASDFASTLPADTAELVAATARPPPPQAGSRVGDPEEPRHLRLATHAEELPPELPPVRAICRPGEVDDPLAPCCSRKARAGPR